MRKRKIDKRKCDFLDEQREEIVNYYHNNNRSLLALEKKFGANRKTIQKRLEEWGEYKPREYGTTPERLENMGEDIQLDRRSGMTINFLELKYGVNGVYLHRYLKSKNLAGRIPLRKPDEEEIERLLEDLESELFFLDELSHSYILPETSILQVAFENKCVVNIDYNDRIDFLMYRDDLTLKVIMRDRHMDVQK